MSGPDPAWEADQGWRVLDADGNVIASGPPIEIEEHFGLPDEQENVNV
jgi:hypothetical protein